MAIVFISHAYNILNASGVFWLIIFLISSFSMSLNKPKQTLRLIHYVDWSSLQARPKMYLSSINKYDSVNRPKACW